MIEALIDIYACIFFFILGWLRATDDEDSAGSVISAMFFAGIWPITLVVVAYLGNKKRKGDKK